jgi:hypothetical protein
MRSSPGSLGASQGRLLLPRARGQYPVHHFGARGDDWAQFMPVDQFCRGRSVVPGQPGDLLDGHAVRGHQGHKSVAQVPRRPACAKAGGFGDLAELAPDVRRIQRRTDSGGEHQIMILPQGPRCQPVFRLPLPVLLEGLDGGLRQCKRPARLGCLSCRHPDALNATRPPTAGQDGPLRVFPRGRRDPSAGPWPLQCGRRR